MKELRSHMFRVFVYFWLIIVFIFSIQLLSAQDFDDNPPIIDSIQNTGKIAIFQDSSVTKMLNRQILINEKYKGIPNGYRIQIFSVSGNDAREKALKFKDNFVEYHTAFKAKDVYELYQPPFFKLRVGDYRNKNEALIVYKKLVKYYPNCYIVKSKINFPVLYEEFEE